MTNSTPELVEANNPCCVCGSGNSSCFFDRQYDKFNYSGEFHMRKCDNCGLLFASPRLDESGIANLYNKNYYVFSKNDSDYFARTAEIYKRTIALLPRSIKNKSVIEIGSGKGYLLAVLQRMGWITSGIEIASDAASYSRNIFNIDCFTGTIDKYIQSSSLKKSNVVLCIDILEHVINPSDFISSVTEVMLDGGYLVIDTPNSNSARAEQEGMYWRGYNPFHIFVFNKTNLTNLLESNGFTITHCFTYNNGNESLIWHKTFSSFFRKLLSPRKLMNAPNNTVPDDLDSCVESCNLSDTYLNTYDYTAEHSKSNRGENLIMIAKLIS